MEIITIGLLLDTKDLERYLEKSGDTYIIPENLIENDHGFMSWKVDGNSLVLFNVYGDGKYWDAFSLELAKRLGLKTIRIGTLRNPKVFEKKYNYNIIGHILEKEVN